MPATALLTSEQYLALPDEFDKNGNHVKDELIGGEVVRMPPPSLIHDLIKNRLESCTEARNSAFEPDARSVMVHTADSVRELKADQKVEDPLLPGFSTPASAFFELT